MMKIRRILVVKAYESKPLLSDTHNESDLVFSFPRLSSLDESSNGSSTPQSSYENPYDFNARFNAPMAFVLVLFLAVFFFVGFFSVYVRHRGSGEEDGRGGGGGGRMRASQGVEKSIIESFPVFTYSLVKGLKQGKQALECAVCLNEFEDDETLRLLPPCNHAFHPDCIDVWLFSHTTCPLCRCSLLPGPNGPAQEPQPQQAGASLQQNEHVVVVIGGQDRIENQDRAANELTNQGRLGNAEGVCRTRANQSRVYNEPTTSTTGSPFRPLHKCSQNIRRSHSTGHSLVNLGGDPDHLSEFHIVADDRYVVDFAKELIQSSKSCLHRSCSCATFCPSGSPGVSFLQECENGREKLWTYTSSVEDTRPGSNPRASRAAEAESVQEFLWLSHTHFDPRINSDRWNVSLHSPVFFRTFSERRAPDLQQQQMPSTSSSSNDNNRQNIRALLHSFTKGFKWV